MRRIREASPGALAAAIVVVFLAGTVLGASTGIGNVCGDAARTELIPVAALLYGAAIFLIAARLTSRAWIVIVASLATIAFSAIYLIAMLEFIQAETCS
jgi:hypothetical protein